MQDEQRLGLFGDMPTRRRLSTSHIGFDSRRHPERAPIERRQVVGNGDTHRGPEIIARFLPASRARIRLVTQRRCQRHHLATGRLPNEKDSLGVDVVFLGVSMHVANGTLKVLVTRGYRTAILQAIVDRRRKEAEARPLLDLDRRTIFLMPAHPTAAMHGNNRRQLLF